MKSIPTRCTSKTAVQRQDLNQPVEGGMQSMLLLIINFTHFTLCSSYIDRAFSVLALH